MHDAERSREKFETFKWREYHFAFAILFVFVPDDDVFKHATCFVVLSSDSDDSTFYESGGYFASLVFIVFQVFSAKFHFASCNYPNLMHATGKSNN